MDPHTRNRLRKESEALSELDDWAGIPHLWEPFLSSPDPDDAQSEQIANSNPISGDGFDNCFERSSAELHCGNPDPAIEDDGHRLLRLSTPSSARASSTSRSTSAGVYP